MLTRRPKTCLLFALTTTKLLEQGELVDESLWQHLSPLAWKHINLVGSYHFSEVRLEGEFRPLREVESRRAKRERGTAMVSVPVVDQEAWNKDESVLQTPPAESSAVQLSLLEGVNTMTSEQSA